LKSLFDTRDVCRDFIGSNNDLTLGTIERVEGVEELLLSSLLTNDELDIVDEENIHRSKSALEFLHLCVTKGENEFVCECLRRHVENSCERIPLKNRVSYRVEKMCLSKSYTTINKEWVIALTRLLGHSHRGGVTELVTITNHEILEGIARVNIIKNLTFNRRLGWNSDRMSGLLLLLTRLLYRSGAHSLNDERCRGTTETR
jgi:hypothetical protein